MTAATAVVNSFRRDQSLKGNELEEINKKFSREKRRSIQAAAHLGIKHALPPTSLGKTIISENPCQDRLLDIEKAKLTTRWANFQSNYETSRRSFLNTVGVKQRKWKGQDEIRMTAMNFPTVPPAGVEGNPDVNVLYTSPPYPHLVTSAGTKLLPFMNLRRERTEYIEKDQTIGMTKLPRVVEIDDIKLKRYNTYCGDLFEQAKYQETLEDKRFQLLSNMLSPQIIAGSDQLSRRPKKKKGKMLTRVLISPGTGREWFLDDDEEDESEIGQVDDAHDYYHGYQMESVHRDGATLPRSYAKVHAVNMQAAQEETTVPDAPRLLEGNTKMKGNTTPKPEELEQFKLIREQTQFDFCVNKTDESSTEKAKSIKKDKKHTHPAANLHPATNTRHTTRQMEFEQESLGFPSIHRQGTFISQLTSRDEIIQKEQELEKELNRIRDDRSSAKNVKNNEKTMHRLRKKKRELQEEKLNLQDQSVIPMLVTDVSGMTNLEFNNEETTFSEADLTEFLQKEKPKKSKARAAITKDIQSQDWSELQKTYGSLRQMWVRNKPIQKNFMRSKRKNREKTILDGIHAKFRSMNPAVEDVPVVPNPSPVEHLTGLVIQLH